MTNYVFDETKIIPQAQELNRLGSPKEDNFLRKLGEYLADGINKAFLTYCPNEIAVRSVFTYDKVNPDLSSFPLLKLYRSSDNHPKLSNSISKAVISYCLSFPQQDQLPGVLFWMSRAINCLLDCYSFEHEDCPSNIIIEDRTTEYRIMVNELSNPVYAFMRVNFSITN